MWDFDELEQVESTASWDWPRLLRSTSVCALALPERADHIESLLAKWGFDGAEIFHGVLADALRLDSWVERGHIVANKDVTSGRVACHFGHLAIIRDFLASVDSSKLWLLIFEDDLSDCGTDIVQRQLLEFLAEVPDDFDILHLGFLWECRETRIQVSDLVYKTKMAVGRHAYMLSRRGAAELVSATLPQTHAGDEMYRATIRERGLAAYQPSEPIFTQDRAKFASRIVSHRRAARDFRPSEEELRIWQGESEALRLKYKLLADTRRHDVNLEEADRQLMQRVRMDAVDRAENPDIDLREPLVLVGSVNDWSPELALESHTMAVEVDEDGEQRQVVHCVRVRVPAGKTEFQIISARSLWIWRLLPAATATNVELECGHRGSVVAALFVGARDSDCHGRNFAIVEPMGGDFVVRVALRRRARHVWYSRVAVASDPQSTTVAAPAGFGLTSGLAADNSIADHLTLNDILPLRLVGEFVKWTTRSPDLDCATLAIEGEEGSGPCIEQRLSFRLLGDHLDFQVVSSRLGFHWRCYPKTAHRGSMLLASGSERRASIGGDGDGHGCHFQIVEDAFSTITLSVQLHVGNLGRLGSTSGVRVKVSYWLEPVGAARARVGIGPTHVAKLTGRPPAGSEVLPVGDIDAK
mmetsp:Transcript_151572/g.484488  ORF Transcript_151572/g.484488 Transcript_151572/m.484488 type:complete len:640 (+) Transcript_151572:130-2049(+)